MATSVDWYILQDILKVKKAKEKVGDMRDNYDTTNSHILKPPYTKEEVDAVSKENNMVLPQDFYDYLTIVSRQNVFSSYPLTILIHQLNYIYSQNGKADEDDEKKEKDDGEDEDDEDDVEKIIQI
jgi:Ran GTPase-activating protein (RanGAP) involved in mRNA processing and transport